MADLKVECHFVLRSYIKNISDMHICITHRQYYDEGLGQGDGCWLERVSGGERGTFQIRSTIKIIF